jgi:hypothetical protein
MMTLLSAPVKLDRQMLSQRCRENAVLFKSASGEGTEEKVLDC